MESVERVLFDNSRALDPSADEELRKEVAELKARLAKA